MDLVFDFMDLYHTQKNFIIHSWFYKSQNKSKRNSLLLTKLTKSWDYLSISEVKLFGNLRENLSYWENCNFMSQFEMKGISELDGIPGNPR